jgi:hypothetical protein
MKAAWRYRRDTNSGGLVTDFEKVAIRAEFAQLEIGKSQDRCGFGPFDPHPEFRD